MTVGFVAVVGVAVVLVIVLTGGDDDKDTASDTGSVPAPAATVPGGSDSGGADNDPTARHCSRVVWYPDIIAQFNSLGVHIEVA